MGDTLFILSVFGVVALHWVAELRPAKRSMWLSELHLDQARIWENTAASDTPSANHS